MKQKDLRLREVPEYTGKIFANCLQMNWTFQVTPHVTQGIGIEVDNDWYICLQTFGNREQSSLKHESWL